VLGDEQPRARVDVERPRMDLVCWIGFGSPVD
jgi:hypothetical protein